MNRIDYLKIIKNKLDNLSDDEFIELIESSIDKNTAKLPVETQEICDVEWLCPNCRNKVGDIVKVDNYCSNCGQKILFNLE